MTAEAIYKNEPDESQVVAAVARASGEVIQLADGRAAYVMGLNARAIGDDVGLKCSGIVELQKTASIAILDGGRVYWDRSANKAHFRPQSGDFYVGVAYGDAAATDTTVKVNLNVEQKNVVFLEGMETNALWTHEATDGSGVTAATQQTDLILAFDAVAEVAQAAIYPTGTEHHIPLADGPIFEAKVAVFDIGDHAALDITFGLANGSHATDFDSVTEAVVFHLDGVDLTIFAESDDGTTEVAATTTTIDTVDDTFNEFWIDCRNLADIQLYIDGVNVLPASVFKLDAATGPVFPILHIEKTSNDTTADLRARFMRCRSTDLATGRV